MWNVYNLICVTVESKTIKVSVQVLLISQWNE